MNNTKKTAMTQSAAKANFGCLQSVASLLNCRVSRMYAAAADMKKIAILSQSGDLPITPL